VEFLNFVEILSKIVNFEQSHYEGKQFLGHFFQRGKQLYKYRYEMTKRTAHLEAEDFRSTVHHLKQLVLIFADAFPPGERRYLYLAQYLIRG
jgi:hypothetical protein